MRLLGAMPFLDRIELSQVAGEANQRVYEEIADLEELGVVAWVKHGSSLLAPTRRYHLTRKGVEWLAANVAIAAGGLAGMDWYRSRALDAALRLPGDRTVGILRQGATTERTGFSKRTWRLREEGGPQTVLTLAPDEVRARHTRRLMAEFPGLALVALESDTVQAAPEDPIWLAPPGAAWLGLPDVLKRGVWRGGTPVEPPLAEIRYPEGIEVPETGLWGPDHLLPAMLRPGEAGDGPAGRLALDHGRGVAGSAGVSKMRVSQLLARLVDGRLVERIVVGRRRRLGLSDWGLAALARRDRTSVGRMRRQWSVAATDDADDAGDAGDAGEPEWWRGVSGGRSRLLARNMEHTDAVHRFLARLSSQAGQRGYRALQYDPPHRAPRHFRHRDRLRSIHPDAFGMLSREDEKAPFFLE